MSIECMHILSKELIDKLEIVKERSMRLPNIPYQGIKTEFLEKEEEVTVYNFLPGLEEVQFVVRKGLENTEVYMVRFGIMARISEESLKELLGSIKMVVDLMNSEAYTEINNLNLIPEEINIAYRTMRSISSIPSNNQIDLLYEEYCMMLKKLHHIQNKNLSLQNSSRKLSR